METVERLLGTCPICEGTFKLHLKRLVHHGFKRPGDGAIHGDCYAVNYPPYEVSCEVTKTYRGMIQLGLYNLRTSIAEHKAGKVTRFTKMEIKYNLYRRELVEIEYIAGVTEPALWARASENHIRELEGQARMYESEIVRLTRLIDNWKLRDIRTVMEEREQNDKATREAKANERQAKKEERDRKEAEKKARREALEAKKTALKQSFIDGFAALVKEPETADRQQRARKLMEKVKKSSIWWHELKVDEDLIKLGLAQRNDQGYIIYS